MPLQVDEKGFVFDPEKKIWLPPLNLKQVEIFDDYHRYLLVHGPRKSGKTYGIVHKVIRHAFDVNNAIFCIVCKTVKNAKSGVWVLLEMMLNHWAGKPGIDGRKTQGCAGFKILEGPKTAGDTKMSFVIIRNRWGGESMIQCHSLEHANDVEAKFKGPLFSGFWLSEFDQYCTEHAWDILCDSLRAPTVDYKDHQIIADLNPPDSGTNNWIHDKWFKFKEEAPAEIDDGMQHLRDSLHRILVAIDDNPQLNPLERKDLELRYRKRKKLYNRFILGIWEQDITDGHFSDVWDEDVHVVGNTTGPKEEWDVIVPTAQCTELLGGWDIGEKKSHSFHILEKVTTEEPVSKRLVVSFRVLDELVVVDRFVSVEEFALQAMEKMKFWEEWMKKNHGIQAVTWRHWSDTSAFDKRASANTTDAAIVYATSAGRIVLRGAPKYRDSNRDKVNLLWQFLHSQRLHVSAQCFKTRGMFAMLRSDPDNPQSKYVKRDEHKHPFDSLSYPILAEAPTDMISSADVDTAKMNAAPTPIFAGF